MTEPKIDVSIEHKHAAPQADGKKHPNTCPGCGSHYRDDELAEHLRAGKLQVKGHLRHPLHAKLYLCHRSDPVAPVVGYLGSSNFTMSGLDRQGELNIDVLDGDACQKLCRWFDERWDDRWSLDISKELVEIIESVD